jgi:predicted Zn-dependent protease
MIFSESEARQLARQALGLSRADSCLVSLSGHDRGNVRFALNSVTTSGAQDDVVLSVESNFGRRSGAVTVNELDDASLAAAVRKSEELARLAPEDPEFLPPLGPQKYLQSRAWFPSTARAGPVKLSSLCRSVLKEADAPQVTAAGYLEAGASFNALATSAGLFAYEKSTGGRFTVTARTADGTGSGWAGTNFHDIARLETARLGRRAMQKARDSRAPVALAPGKYTVVLEAAAVCDLLGMMLWHFDARRADEGRSFLARKGGGTKRGEQVFGGQVHLYSDPRHAVAPGAIYSTDGLPATPRAWIEGGVVKNLVCSRFWAQKTGQEPVPHPTNLVMTGGRTTVAEMIRATRRGILVTRFWYIREVDPRTLVFTGLTRDGTFLIEQGRVTRPIKNLRFNESPVAMLNNIVALGPSERTNGSEIEGWPVAVPPLLVKDFTFSSLSDAV